MVESKTYRFSFRDLGLSVHGIEEVIGYMEGSEREYVASQIEQVLNEAEKIVDARAQYRIFDKVRFNPDAKTVSLEGETFSTGKIVFNQVKKSAMAALFLCTAGPEISDMSKKAMLDGDLLSGYIYDVTGSEVVEAVTDLMQADLVKTLESEGLKITNRYSPGYCGWNVSEQHKLFSFFPENSCGIKLTSSALMDPIKSVSGIIGIGKDVKLNPYTCRMCDMKDCIYRRLRENMTG